MLWQFGIQIYDPRVAYFGQLLPFRFITSSQILGVQKKEVEKTSTSNVSDTSTSHNF